MFVTEKIIWPPRAVDNLSDGFCIKTFKIEIVMNAFVLSDHPVLRAYVARRDIQPPLRPTMIFNNIKGGENSLI